MRFGVVVFPGTWSDCDFHYVISEALHQPVKYLWHRDRDLSGFDCVILPGGFSYGDYLRAGAVAGRSPVVDALPDFVADRKSTRLNSSHSQISYAVFCLKKKKNIIIK